MQNKILLNTARYVNAEEKNISPRIQLSINKQEVNEDLYNESINQYDVYLDERERCSTARLCVDVNLVASNVLCNRITEIVKNEDSDNAECLNFSPHTISGVYQRSGHVWGSDMLTCTNDTQITYDGNVNKNYTYLCGLDIFNNHILRSKTKLGNYSNSNGDAFNTLSDIMCDEYGSKYVSHLYKSSNVIQHLYTKDNVLGFEDCLNEKLQDKNGWLGFVNVAKMTTYDGAGNDLGISRVINNEPIGKFIELYPNHSHFQMTPYFNNSRHRYENNWEYCLTYPYSSTTENISCINSKLKTLIISHIDENSSDDDGLYKVVIYSVAKHGLSTDDTIIIYRSNNTNEFHEVVETDLVVDTIIDDYTFAVYTSEEICRNWISIYDESNLKASFTNINSTQNTYATANGDVYHAFNEFINFDIDNDSESYIGSQHLSFARLIDGEECEYYIRIFSRLPNFAFCNETVDEKFIYSDCDGNGTLNVDKYAAEEYGHANIMTKIAYSKNIYGDTLNQIVFNDDIHFDGLKDNLGRPLTSLYLTFMKTNYGYHQWYDGSVKNPLIQHSHCFGKLNCGFKYNTSLIDSKYNTGNVNYMNNVSSVLGLSQTSFRPSIYSDREINLESDGIGFSSQKYFHGDLCMYSNKMCYEQVLQPIYHRFNTQQRELAGSSLGMKGNFGQLRFQNITRDDFTSSWSNHTLTVTVLDKNPTAKPEGYYYQAHHEIPIRTFSGNINEFNPAATKLTSIKRSGLNYELQTIEANYINTSDAVYIYSISTGESIPCTIKNILSTTRLLISLNNNQGLSCESGDVDNYRVYVKPTNVPSYARTSKDGSGILRWRDIVQNGFEEVSSTITEYPFTNGCLYIHKKVNLFVKRQDPFGIFGLADDLGQTVMSGYPSSIEHPEFLSDFDDNNAIGDNTYITEKNGIC